MHILTHSPPWIELSIQHKQNLVITQIIEVNKQKKQLNSLTIFSQSSIVELQSCLELPWLHVDEDKLLLRE